MENQVEYEFSFPNPFTILFFYIVFFDVTHQKFDKNPNEKWKTLNFLPNFLAQIVA